MAKVITFSRQYPGYHKRAGEPTYFVEKFWESIGLPDAVYTNRLPDEYSNFLRRHSQTIWPKHHTIRGGHRFKKGEYFSPHVWSGRPYHTKQITFAPDTLITNVWNFDIDKHGSMFINGKHFAYYGDISKNDGLTPPDFLSWFKMDNYEHYPPKAFDGQIICWNPDTNYE